MQAVILAGGEGVRMRPLTLEVPKPLLKVGEKTLLEHTFSVLPAEITEVILVVGYLGQKIHDFCKHDFYGRNVKYVWQDKKLGTGHALKLCRSYLGNGRFLILFADDLHRSQGIQNLLKHDKSLLVAEHHDPKRFGVVELNVDGSIKDVVEKPENPRSNLISTGVMVLDPNIFNYEPDLHPNGEYYLTSMFDKMIKDHNVMAVKTSHWFPIATPEDLKSAESFQA